MADGASFALRFRMEAEPRSVVRAAASHAAGA